MVSLSRANANAVTACQTPTVVKELRTETTAVQGILEPSWCPDGWSGWLASRAKREVFMLTRRGFAGFASCALCAVTGFIATDPRRRVRRPYRQPATRGRFCRRWTVR